MNTTNNNIKHLEFTVAIQHNNKPNITAKRDISDKLESRINKPWLFKDTQDYDGNTIILNPSYINHLEKISPTILMIQELYIKDKNISRKYNQLHKTTDLTKTNEVILSFIKHLHYLVPTPNTHIKGSREKPVYTLTKPAKLLEPDIRLYNDMDQEEALQEFLEPLVGSKEINNGQTVEGMLSKLSQPTLMIDLNRQSIIMETKNQLFKAKSKSMNLIVTYTTSSKTRLYYLRINDCLPFLFYLGNRIATGRVNPWDKVIYHQSVSDDILSYDLRRTLDGYIKYYDYSQQSHAIVNWYLNNSEKFIKYLNYPEIMLRAITKESTTSPLGLPPITSIFFGPYNAFIKRLREVNIYNTGTIDEVIVKLITDLKQTTKYDESTLDYVKNKFEDYISTGSITENITRTKFEEIIQEAIVEKYNKRINMVKNTLEGQDNFATIKPQGLIQTDEMKEEEEDEFSYVTPTGDKKEEEKKEESKSKLKPEDVALLKKFNHQKGVLRQIGYLVYDNTEDFSGFGLGVTLTALECFNKNSGDMSQIKDLKSLAAFGQNNNLRYEFINKPNTLSKWFKNSRPNSIGGVLTVGYYETVDGVEEKRTHCGAFAKKGYVDSKILGWMAEDAQPLFFNPSELGMDTLTKRYNTDLPNPLRMMLSIGMYDYNYGRDMNVTYSGLTKCIQSKYFIAAPDAQWTDVEKFVDHLLNRSSQGELKYLCTHNDVKQTIPNINIPKGLLIAGSIVGINIVVIELENNITTSLKYHLSPTGGSVIMLISGDYKVLFEYGPIIARAYDAGEVDMDVDPDDVVDNHFSCNVAITDGEFLDNWTATLEAIAEAKKIRQTAVEKQRNKNTVAKLANPRAAREAEDFNANLERKDKFSMSKTEKEHYDTYLADHGDENDVGRVYTDKTKKFTVLQINAADGVRIHGNRVIKCSYFSIGLKNETGGNAQLLIYQHLIDLKEGSTWWVDYQTYIPGAFRNPSSGRIVTYGADKYMTSKEMMGFSEIVSMDSDILKHYKINLKEVQMKVKSGEQFDNFITIYKPKGKQLVTNAFSGYFEFVNPSVSDDFYTINEVSNVKLDNRSNDYNTLFNILHTSNPIIGSKFTKSSIGGLTSSVTVNNHSTVLDQILLVNGINPTVDHVFGNQEFVNLYYSVRYSTINQDLSVPQAALSLMQKQSIFINIMDIPLIISLVFISLWFLSLTVCLATLGYYGYKYRSMVYKARVQAIIIDSPFYTDKTKILLAKTLQPAQRGDNYKTQMAIMSITLITFIAFWFLYITSYRMLNNMINYLFPPQDTMDKVLDILGYYSDKLYNQLGLTNTYYHEVMNESKSYSQYVYPAEGLLFLGKIIGFSFLAIQVITYNAYLVVFYAVTDSIGITYHKLVGEEIPLYPGISYMLSIMVYLTIELLIFKRAKLFLFHLRALKYVVSISKIVLSTIHQGIKNTLLDMNELDFEDHRDKATEELIEFNVRGISNRLLSSNLKEELILINKNEDKPNESIIEHVQEKMKMEKNTHDDIDDMKEPQSLEKKAFNNTHDDVNVINESQLSNVNGGELIDKITEEESDFATAKPGSLPYQYYYAFNQNMPLPEDYDEEAEFCGQPKYPDWQIPIIKDDIPVITTFNEKCKEIFGFDIPKIDHNIMIKDPSEYYDNLDTPLKSFSEDKLFGLLYNPFTSIESMIYRKVVGIEIERDNTGFLNKQSQVVGGFTSNIDGLMVPKFINPLYKELTSGENVDGLTLKKLTDVIHFGYDCGFINDPHTEEINITSHPLLKLRYNIGEKDGDLQPEDYPDQVEQHLSVTKVSGATTITTNSIELWSRLFDEMMMLSHAYGVFDFAIDLEKSGKMYTGIQIGPLVPVPGFFVLLMNSSQVNWHRYRIMEKLSSIGRYWAWDSSMESKFIPDPYLLIDQQAIYQSLFGGIAQTIRQITTNKGGLTQALNSQSLSSKVNKGNQAYKGYKLPILTCRLIHYAAYDVVGMNLIHTNIIVKEKAINIGTEQTFVRGENLGWRLNFERIKEFDDILEERDGYYQAKEGANRDILGPFQINPYVSKTAVEAGSGESGTEGVFQSLLSCFLMRDGKDPQLFMAHPAYEFNKYCKAQGYTHLHTFNRGVPMNVLLHWIKQNDININVFWTGYKTSLTGGNFEHTDEDYMSMIIHRGHARPGVPRNYNKNIKITVPDHALNAFYGTSENLTNIKLSKLITITKQITMNCCCPLGVAIPHKPEFECTLGIKLRRLREENLIIDKKLRSNVNNGAILARTRSMIIAISQDNWVKNDMKDLSLFGVYKQRTNMTIEKAVCKHNEEIEKMVEIEPTYGELELVEGTGYKKSGNCMGYKGGTFNPDSLIIKAKKFENCDSKPCNIHQVGLIFDLEMHHNKGGDHNTLMAFSNRVNSGKKLFDPKEMRKFTEWCKQFIDKHFKIDHDANNNLQDAHEMALELIKMSNKTSGIKKFYIEELTKAIETNYPKQDFFVFPKKEIIAGKESMPRMIGPLEHSIRNLTRAVGSAFMEQFEQVMKGGIKGQSPEQIFDKFIEIYQNNDICIATDFKSYDNSITAPLLEIERYAVLKTTPIAASILDLVNKGKMIGSTSDGRFNFLINKRRLSGEPLTSHGNSLLSYLLNSYCFETDRVITEGDDGGVFLLKHNYENIIEKAETMYDKLGMDVTIGVNHGIDGLEFGKMTFKSIGSDIFWYRKPFRMFLKMGWDLKHRGNWMSKQFGLAATGKILSWLEEYKNIPFMTKFLKTVYDMYPIKATDKEERWFMPTTSAGLNEFLESEYGEEINSLTQSVKKHQLKQIESVEFYPKIFHNYLADSKPGRLRPKLPLDLSTPEITNGFIVGSTVPVNPILRSHSYHSYQNNSLIIMEAESQIQQDKLAYIKSVLTENLMQLTKDEVSEIKQDLVDKKYLHPKPEGMTTFVLTSQDIFDWAKNNLLIFAALGSLVHVPSDMYNLFKMTKGVLSREYISPFTKHNGKMGYNWSIRDRQYIKKENNLQPMNSAYKPVLEKYGYNNIAKDYTMSDSDFNIKLSKAQPSRKGVASTGYYAEDVKGMELYKNKSLDLTKKLEDSRMKVDLMRENILGLSEKIAGTTNEAEEDVRNIIEDLANDIQDTMDESENHYIKSLLNPFDNDAKGGRVPQNMPENTFTINERIRTDFVAENGKCIIMGNFAGLMMRPLTIISEGTVGTLQTTLDGAINQYKLIDEGAEQHSFINDVLAINTGNGDTVSFVTPASVVQTQFATQDTRLVAGSIVIRKTSKNDSESGTIKAYYNRTGNKITNSLSQFLENIEGSPGYVKEYIASDVGHNTNNRLIGITYVPSHVDDVTTSNKNEALTITPTNDFLNEIEYVFNALPGSVKGPTVLGTLAAGGFRPDDSPNIGFPTLLSINAITERHGFLIVLDDISDGTTFELEFSRHVEMRPTTQDLGRETKFVLLSQEDSVFSLLKKTKLSTLFTTWDKKHDSVWSYPSIRNRELMKSLDETEITGWKDIKKLVRKQAPAIIKAIKKNWPIIQQMLTTAALQAM